MKSFFVSACISLSFTTMCYSQNINEKQLPVLVKEAFLKAYNKPGKVKWGKENKNEYEASFTVNGKATSLVYSGDGVLQETETEISNAELPPAIIHYIVKNYPKANITEAAKIIKKNGSIVYETEINKKDLLFDKTGKLLNSNN